MMYFILMQCDSSIFLSIETNLLPSFIYCNRYVPILYRRFVVSRQQNNDPSGLQLKTVLEKDATVLIDNRNDHTHTLHIH
jgi:hypothetical protein